MKISSEAQPSGTATGRSQGELGERLLSSPRCKVVTVSLIWTMDDVLYQVRLF